MTLDFLRPAADRALSPFVGAARRAGITPDAVSALAFVLAVGAGGAFALARPTTYFAGALLVGLNGVLDLIDGELARELGVESAAGDLLDHVLDRYADIAVVAGLAAGAGRPALGFAAVTGVLMTSYLGTQAEAVGLDRVYAGLLGRADRLVLVAVAATVAAAGVAPAGVDPVAVLLGLFALVGHLTAVQRFVGAWRALR
jgi:archaetidylinositol phosphate synthase